MGVTKEIAEKIAAKLGAVCNSKKNRPHDLYHVYHNGSLVTSFGIRRSSRKDQGHGHIPRALYVTPHQAQQLGQCSMSKDEWIKAMIEKKIIS
jgi:hypothetical protein